MASHGHNALAPRRLRHLSIESMRTSLENGDYSIDDLVAAHLNVIRKFNGSANAIIETTPGILGECIRLHRQNDAKGRIGSLHGVPVIVKCNVNTTEFPATAGSYALQSSAPSSENTAITRLRRAGAVILGSSNMSEWANWRTKNFGDDGWSATGGQTYGAYHEKMDPNGSSSGSGVGVDLGMAVLAVGSETWGSIINPSSRNNIVGIKPTVGSVPMNAVVPISPIQDTIGPMARTVVDAAEMLAVMADDPAPSTRFLEWSRLPVDERSVSGWRVGVPRNALGDVPAFMMNRFNHALELLKNQGVEIVDIQFPCVDKFNEQYTAGPDVICANLAPEFRVAIDEYLAGLESNPNQIRTIQHIIDYMKKDPREEYSERDTYWLERSATLDHQSLEYVRGLEESKYFAEEGGILEAVRKSSLHAIMAPSDANIPNFSAARGGLPVVSVPLGYTPLDAPVQKNISGRLISSGPNIPYGLSILGPKDSEETLLKLAYLMEELTSTRESAESHRIKLFQA